MPLLQRVEFSTRCAVRWRAAPYNAKGRGRRGESGDSRPASRRFASMSWHEALLFVRVRPGICPGMALGGGKGRRVFPRTSLVDDVSIFPNYKNHIKEVWPPPVLLGIPYHPNVSKSYQKRQAAATFSRRPPPLWQPVEIRTTQRPPAAAQPTVFQGSA